VGLRGHRLPSSDRDPVAERRTVGRWGLQGGQDGRVIEVDSEHRDRDQPTRRDGLQLVPIVVAMADRFPLRATLCSMRRGDPERIYQAQRAGILARLTQNERVGEVQAEDWISRWERHAEAEGIAHGHAFWDAAWDWIAEQRAPKRDMGAESDDGQVYGG
jgi:hypothetical protein